MRDIFIPRVIDIGAQPRFMRLAGGICAALVILLYLLGFYAIYVFGLTQYLLMLVVPQPPEQIPDSMQYVLVSEDLIDEEQLPEQVRQRGRVTRVSRDTSVDPNLPKLGPQMQEQSPVAEFAEGHMLPSAPSTPMTPATQAATPTPPLQAIPPTPPLPPLPELEQPDKPVEQPVEKPQEKPIEQPQEVSKTADIAPQSLPEVADAPLWQVKQPAAAETDPTARAAQKPETEPNAPETALTAQKTEQKPEEIAKPVTPQPPQPPAPQQPPLPELPPLPEPGQSRINIPVQRIAAAPQAQGGTVGTERDSSAAMSAESRQMAVLRDRYGEYMDLILRRIRGAIITQQQLSPIMFMRGSVVMTFTINPQGRLSDIRHVRAEPGSLPTESGAARQVLQSVAAGAPFPPPTPEMLADPDFQKITIFFIFEPK